MKKNHFQKDLSSLINNIPSTWDQLKIFLEEDVKEVADRHFPKNTNAYNNLEDTMKLIFRLNARLE